MTSIDDAINKISGSLFKVFTSKWSQHQHNNDVSNCTLTLTYDGNWKLDRSKCCYENKWINCNEFGDIQTGCLNTPMKKSYFCHEHQNKQLCFQLDNEFVYMDPAEIKPISKSLDFNFFYLSF
jgi:hypothetical protein